MQTEAQVWFVNSPRAIAAMEEQIFSHLGYSRLSFPASAKGAFRHTTSTRHQQLKNPARAPWQCCALSKVRLSSRDGTAPAGKRREVLVGCALRLFDPARVDSHQAIRRMFFAAEFLLIDMIHPQENSTHDNREGHDHRPRIDAEQSRNR